jgi:hypothetical protein
MTDEALRDLQPRSNKLYAKTGRPSIAPERLLRALLLQVLYSVRSERMLMEQLDYNLLFRWFVGLNMVRSQAAEKRRHDLNCCPAFVIVVRRPASYWPQAPIASRSQARNRQVNAGSTTRDCGLAG